MSATDGDLRRLFKSHVRGHWISIESGSTSGGIPDSNFCVEGTEGWVEFKQTRAWAVSFRPTQVSLIANRVKAGGRVWIAVRRWKNVADEDALWVMHGREVVRLANGTLRDCLPYVHIWTGGPRNWDWGGVARLLVS